MSKNTLESRFVCLRASVRVWAWVSVQCSVSRACPCFIIDVEVSKTRAARESELVAYAGMFLNECVCVYVCVRNCVHTRGAGWLYQHTRFSSDSCLLKGYMCLTWKTRGDPWHFRFAVSAVAFVKEIISSLNYIWQRIFTLSPVVCYFCSHLCSCYSFHFIYTCSHITHLNLSSEYLQVWKLKSQPATKQNQKSWG